jgi:hypothetical protein
MTEEAVVQALLPFCPPGDALFFEALLTERLGQLVHCEDWSSSMLRQMVKEVREAQERLYVEHWKKGKPKNLQSVDALQSTMARVRTSDTRLSLTS